MPIGIASSAELDSTEVEPDPNEPLNLQSMGRDTGRGARVSGNRSKASAWCAASSGFHQILKMRSTRYVEL